MNIQFEKMLVLIFLVSCKQSKKELPIHVSENSRNKIQSLRFVADSLFRRNRYIEAIKYFDTLVQLDPRNGSYYYCRGYSYTMVYQRPKIKEAIADYNKSIELGYEKADSYFNLGLSYMFEDDSTAMFCFEKSLEINPNKAIAVVLLEQCKKRLRDKHPK